MVYKKSITVISCLQVWIIALFFLVVPAQKLLAQSEFKPWGNLNGIRIKGQLMEFNSCITVVGKSWSKVSSTGKELQNPKYVRTNDKQIVNTQIGSLQFKETVAENGRGAIKVTIKCLPQKDTTLKGVYFNVSLPEAIYKGATVKLGNDKKQLLSETDLDNEGDYLHSSAQEIYFSERSQSIRIRVDTVSQVIVRPDTLGIQKKFIQLYLPICSGKISKGDVFERTFEINVSGKIDKSPVNMQLDTSTMGSVFAGFGGNFRLQNPKTDPQVIDYCLKNLRVAWGRVEMPWRNWQPDSLSDPQTSAIDTPHLNAHVRQSMEMARRLSRMNIPVILTAWSPPAWAVVGKLHYGKSPEGVWGNPLNKDMTPLIYQSITDYILYLKANYGVDVAFFSFNESDLGINVRQTAEEHDQLIKGLGAYFVSKGLKTKLLLGDNSDATTYQFVYPAMNDPEATPFMGAVSFHSWRGWDTEILQKWADVAKKTNLPLIVGEGSIDAAAWAYPAYFQEPSYALEEINLYTRLLAICQPLSILQWQLTADYSPLTGGGIYGDTSPLKPTLRFWNLKQLASTPQDLFYMPLNADKAGVSCAALGDVTKHQYTLHIVNNGTERKVHLKGLPSNVKEFKVFVTSGDKQMKLIKPVKVSNHEAVFTLDSRCFTTLISE
jgi:hypothetical protein